MAATWDKLLTHRIGILISALAFVFYLWLEFRLFPIQGFDSPWYFIQVQSVLSIHHLYFSINPLALYLMSFFSLFLGVEAGVRFTAALAGALSILMVYFVSMKLTNNNRVAAVGAQLFAVLSFEYLRLFEDLFKNEVGVVFLLVFIYVLQSELFVSKVTLKSILVVAIPFVLVAATHVLDVGIALLFGTLALFTFYSSIRKLATKVALFAIPVAILPMSYLVLPDFGHLIKSVNMVGETLDVLGDLSNWSIFREGYPMMAFFFVMVVVSVWLLHLLRKTSDKKLRSYVVLSQALLIILNLPFLVPDYGWRFALMSFIPATFIFAILFSVLSKNHEARRFSFSAQLMAIVFMTVFSVPATIGQIATFQPTITTQQYNDLAAMRPYLATSSLRVVTVDGNLTYWVDYLGNVNAMGDPPPSHYLLVTSHVPSDGIIIFRGQNLTLVQK